jgi:hypothetical protein
MNKTFLEKIIDHIKYKDITISDTAKFPFQDYDSFKGIYLSSFKDTNIFLYKEKLKRFYKNDIEIDFSLPFKSCWFEMVDEPILSSAMPDSEGNVTPTIKDDSNQQKISLLGILAQELTAADLDEDTLSHFKEGSEKLNELLESFPLEEILIYTFIINEIRKQVNRFPKNYQF